jgi:hypothetical protein
MSYTQICRTASHQPAVLCNFPFALFPSQSLQAIFLFAFYYRFRISVCQELFCRDNPTRKEKPAPPKSDAGKKLIPQ